MTAAEQVPPVDLRTRIAAAFEAEDARNWGYDHGFEADDFETLAFADVAIAVMAGEERPLAAADEDRDRLEAENAELRAKIIRLRTAWRSARLRAEETRDHRAERTDAVAVARWAVAENYALKRALGWMRVTDKLPPAEPPLYVGPVEWVVQAHEPERWGVEWEQIRSPYSTPEAAHADAARWRALPGSREVRVLAVESTYRLDASRAPERPAGAITSRATPDA